MEEIFENYWRIKLYRSELTDKIPTIISSGDPELEASDLAAPQLSIYFSHLKDGSKVLDIGAGDKLIQKALKNRGIHAKYFSMDTAKRGEIHYDYENLDEIDDSFDLIIMQEVLEHMPLEFGYKYLKKAYTLLNDKGYLVVTVPNIRRPVHFWNSDFTHTQHYPLGDLYGLLRSIGFSEESIFRFIEIRNPKQTVKQKIIRFTQKILFKLMDFGYPHGVLIKIQKS